MTQTTSSWSFHIPAQKGAPGDGGTPAETGTCVQITYSNWVYHDSTGGQHAFSAQTMSATASGNGWINNPDDYTCTGTSASTATAADGSGYVLSLTNYKVGTLTLASGAQATPPVNPTIASLAANNTDASGNVISSDAAGNVTDTTGNVVLSVGGTAGGNRTYTYKDMNGNSQTVTMTYKTYTVQTNFGCGGSKVVGEYGPVSTSLVDTISFPDGSAYHLSYESTPSGTSITAGSVTGRLAGVELPQGGTIQYAYNGGSNGIECADGSTAGLTRTLNSDSGSSTSTWSYTRTSPNGTGTSQTTVIDGLSNTSVYNFVEASNFTQTPGAYYETSRSIYQGAASGTPLLARTTCYNETTTSPTPCASTTTKILMPPIQIDTYETLDGIETHGATAKYNSYGLQTEADVYDFGGSTSRGALLRKEVWTYGYDIPGLVTEDDVYDGSGTLAGKTVYAYDGATPTPSSGVPRHVNVFYPRGNLTSMTQYASAGTSYTSTFTYEDTGSLLTSTTPSGTATLTYDPTFIYNTGATLPTPSSGVTLGASESFDTANTGLPLTSTDANGQITRIPSYDAMLRATETEYPDGGETTYSYSSTTATQSTLQGLGSSSTTETEYDGYGRTSRVEVANGQSGNGYYQTDTCYDGNGNASFTSYTYQGAGFGASKVCSGAGDSKTYDVLGRVTSVGRANNESRSIQYLGRAKKYVDENGVTRISQVDGLGRTTTVCEISSHTLSGVSPTTCGTDIAGTGFVTSYSYALATPTTTITQGAQTRTFQSDWLGRPTSVTEPESGTTTYSYLYTSTGLQVTRKRPRANQTNSSTLTTTTTQYDTLGRVISISYTDGTPTKTFAYDQSAGANFSDLTQANLKGRLSLASISGTAGTAYSYDPMGRTSALDECLPSGCGTVAYNRQLQYTYDLAGDVISSTDGAGVVSTYTVSPASEILSLTSSRSDATDPANLVSKVQTGPFGPVSYNLGNGLAGAYSYDALGRLSGGTVSSGDTQTYGFSNGWKGQQLTGSSDSVLNQGSTYGYDEFNRLASRTVNSGTGPNYGWVYDRYGNRLQQNITGGTGSGSTFTVSVNPANNQITTGGYAYDAAGNMTNDGFHTYTYDAEGHITAVDGGQTATYVYNALNQRVSASVGGTATEYVFNAAGKRVSEWNGATRAQIKGKYYWGALPVAYYANGAVHFEHQDWLGTERERTTYNGGVEGSYISLPFGDGFSTLTGADADANHYGTLDHDAETATDHAQFRQYSEAQGRWLSPDPYSGSYDASNPQSFNRYVYAGNNPLAAVDPSGLICFGDLRDSLPTSNCAIQELNTGTGGGGGVTTNGGQNVQDSDGNWWFLGDDGSINFVGSYPIMASGSATLPPNIDTSLMPLNYISLVPYDYSTTNSVGGSGSGSGSATNNATQQKQQTQPQHFWQKPGCGAALAEFGVGVAGTAITVGAVAAAIYLGPEMFEGIEGAATLLHIAPVGAPGLVMMGDGGFKATQTCF